MTLIATFFGAILSFLLAIVATIAAIRSRRNNRRITYTTIAILLVGIMVFLIVGLLPPPSLSFSAAAPVPSSLTMYFTQGSSETKSTTPNDLVALRVKDGSTRFIHTISDNAEVLDMAIDSSSTDTLYVEEATGVYPTQNIVLKALHTRDGRQIWQRSLPEMLRHIFIKDGIMYGNAGDTIIVLNMQDGSERWRASPFHFPNPPGNPNPHISVAAGIVFVDEPTEPILYALQGDTGAVLWQVPDVATFSVSNEEVYAVQRFGTLMALRATDGSLLWQITGKYFNANLYSYIGFPVADGVVYAVGDDKREQANSTIYALRVTDGALLWSHQTDEVRWLTVSNGTVFFYHDANTLAALRAQDGSMRWQNKASDPTTFYITGTVVGGAIVATSTNLSNVCFGECGKVGYINVINATSGTSCWRYEHSGNLVIADTA